MTVYCVVIEAVYDHGVAGVFATREDAVEAVVALSNVSDGHHSFRIDEREVGKLMLEEFKRKLTW